MTRLDYSSLRLLGRLENLEHQDFVRRCEADDAKEVLREILTELRALRSMLEVRFAPAIYWWDNSSAIWSTEMAAITAGTSAAFLGSVTASDNSTVTASGFTWSASDPSVVIAPVASDPTGASVEVTVPASDVATTFTLKATATAVSTTSKTPQQVTASLPVTISPAIVPVTFTLTIIEKAVA